MSPQFNTYSCPPYKRLYVLETIGVKEARCLSFDSGGLFKRSLLREPFLKGVTKSPVYNQEFPFCFLLRNILASPLRFEWHFSLLHLSNEGILPFLPFSFHSLGFSVLLSSIYHWAFVIRYSITLWNPVGLYSPNSRSNSPTASGNVAIIMWVWRKNSTVEASRNAWVITGNW